MDLQKDLGIDYLESRFENLEVARFIVVGFYSPLKCDQKP
jgi:hypothetical protein